MNDCNVIIGLACTSSVETGEETEEKYLKVYKPFLRELYKYRDIKAVLYIPGILLEWFEENHPEIIMLLEELVKKRKQVELLGSGFYDPVLPMLTPQDRTGQIEALTTLIRKKFGKRPRGFWVTGSYWENTLILPIKNSGMDYVFMDYNAMDNCFSSDNDYFQPYITEDNGKIIVVYPVHNKLISSYESNSAAEFADMIVEQAGGSRKIISLIFNEDIVRNSREKWIGEIFESLSGSSKIKIINPYIFLKNEPRFQKKYFQNKYFYKKNIADNEVLNLVYSRMIHVQTLINQVRGDKYRKKSAVEALWAGQNFISYSLQTDDISEYNIINERRRTYKNLIEAELLTRQKGVFIPSLLKTDFDLDGLDEFLYQGEEYNLFLHLDGGSVFEFDCLKERWNYSDIIELQDGKYSAVKSFIDFLFDINASGKTPADYHVQDVLKIRKREYGILNFDREKKQLELVLKISSPDEDLMLKLNKTYRLMKKKYEVCYRITNLGIAPVSKKFASEINLSLFNRDRDTDEKTLKISGNEIGIEDSCFSFTIRSDKEVLLSFDEVTEKNRYYYTQAMMIWDINNLDPGKTWENKVEFRL